MHNQLPPAEWVRRQFGLPEPVPQQTEPPRKQYKPRRSTPRSERQKHLATCRIVKAVKEGRLTCRQALLKEGFPTYYQAAIRECIAGAGPITDAIKSGSLATIPESVGRGQACFVRWFYDLPKLRGQDHPDNAKLRLAFKLTKLTACEIARAVEMHETTIGDFMSGRQPRMFDANRARCFAWLDGLKK